MHVYVGTPDFVTNSDRFSKTSEFENVNGTIYYGEDEICSAEGKHFGTYIDSKGNRHAYVYVDSADRATELIKSR